ncbi:rhomboid family protein [Fulvivirga sedimenti]|uniref:Rhomboid family intramembrane serine protease n=1 Tax=Fulvivirga sedimenti TaxID=2879465 RepID=A0A9X1HVM1_9BACT|nr:rhomboid family intramembrane serine protease [Fulvivirga sedimenti]MCA6075568.1 rhomboid family intramembrane serine protease [Fulvivirga sedimenti]MCA6076745.1 rhomboid family intramembrane serine protease [Fulvivirga sedimenti]MCA6077873.1 rhomboid family intramembrane serine protease [Fulvivirga sedimenti]
MNGQGFLQDFKNVFSRPNNEYIRLIVINVVVFVVLGLAQVFTDISIGRGAVDISREYLGLPMHWNELLFRLWTPITYMFVHDGFFHILFNMLFLYWFGRILAEYLGGPKVVNLYVLGGLFGAVIYLTIYPVLLQLLNPNMDISMVSPSLVGASAGVFAVVFGTATLMPNYTIFLLFLGPVRIKYIALFYVLSFFLSLSGPNSGGELAHIGGALMGFLYIKQLQNGSDMGAWIQTVISGVGGLFKPKSKIKVTHRSASAASGRTASRGTTRTAQKPSGSSASQEEIDAILDKISEKGYESLTKEEKQKLFNASKH